MKATKEQKEMHAKCITKNNTFIFPCCEVEIAANFPIIENIGDWETKTQIMCQYGCGFIFIEDYLKK